MDKKILVFVAVGLVGSSILCGLLACGNDGYHVTVPGEERNVGPFTIQDITHEASFGVWKACADGTCVKYGTNL